MVRALGDGASGHLLAIEPDECRRLLSDAVVGRLSWGSAQGLVTLPVAYGVHSDGRIGVRTSDRGILAELAQPTAVAFEADDVDASTLTGWSVLVQGTARAWVGEMPAALVRPWAPGTRTLELQIEPHTWSGRIVSAD